jgi:hypothetical protein
MKMDTHFDQRKFLKVSGMSLGIGALEALAHPCPLHRHHRLDRGRCLFAQEPQPRVVTITAKRFELTPNQSPSSAASRSRCAFRLRTETTPHKTGRFGSSAITSADRATETSMVNNLE